MLIKCFSTPTLTLFRNTHPHKKSIPAHFLQVCNSQPVPFFILLYFIPPPLRPGLRHHKVPAAFVPVPEAAMHKNSGMVFRQHNIRLTGQFLFVQSVTESPAEKPAPQLHLRFGIPAAYAAHVVAAGLRAVYIGHGCLDLIAVEKQCFRWL